MNMINSRAKALAGPSDLKPSLPVTMGTSATPCQDVGRAVIWDPRSGCVRVLDSGASASGEKAEGSHLREASTFGQPWKFLL